MRSKYKIEEIRNSQSPSKFFLKEKFLFWWEKVPVYPNYRDCFSFNDLSFGVDYVSKRRGELLSIEVKINKKKK